MIPAIAALYTPDILETAKKRFGIETIKDLGGFESYVYEYSKNNSNYILKITHTIRRSVGMIRAELDFVNFLRKKDIQVAGAVPSEQGKYVEEILAEEGNFLAYAFEKIEGTVGIKTNWTEEVIQNWGGIIGQMHQATCDYARPADFPPRQRWWEDDIYKMDQILKPEETEMKAAISKLLREIKDIETPKNAWGLIHGDLHQGNFFWNEQGIWAFDFDDCEYGHFVRDIAICLYYATWDIGTKQEISVKEFLILFLKGYFKHYDLDKKWIYKISTFLRLRDALLYLVKRQAWEGTELNEKQQKGMEMQVERILAGKPIVELDYEEILEKVLL